MTVDDAQWVRQGMRIGMSEHKLASLTALGEGFTTEFKRSLPANLGAEICAFANATGGVILLGVTDEGDAVGSRTTAG